MKKNGLLVAMLALLLVATVSCDKTTPVPFVSPIGFETVTLGEMGYLKESSFNEDGLLCENNYNAEWNAWKGFACSSLVDSVTSGYTNELSVSAGKAYLGQKFAVVYEDSAVCKFSNNGEYKIDGLYVTNSTYAYLDMKNGSAYSKKFVAGDWFKVIIKGFSATNVLLGTREVYLADFRDGKTTLLNTWGYVSLEEAIPAKVQRLEFYFDSSDKGNFGVNTPKYVCIDNVLVVR